MRATIPPTRCESPGVNGRNRTRDCSGVRIVALRLTWIGMVLSCGERARRTGLTSDGHWFPEARQHVLRQPHFSQ
jgi:hypothetical protein